MTAPATMHRESTPVLRAIGAAARGYSRVFAAGPLAARLSPAAPVRLDGFSRPLVVHDRRQVAEGVVELTMTAPAGDRLPAWAPGAHVDVVTPEGRLRNYSLCGDPADRDRYRIAVRLLPGGGGGSRELHSVGVGDRLTVRGPRNAFPFYGGAPGYVFIAAGIGITPLLPMARAAAAGSAPWTLIHLGRSRSTMPYLDEPRRWPGGHVVVRTSDRDGRTDVRDLLRLAGHRHAVYACGPPPLLDDILKLAPQELPSTASLHLERFTGPAPDGRPFTLTLRRSGHVLRVEPHESALERIRTVLPDVPHSCTRGFCGTCRTRVLSGAVEHRDSALLPDEREREMTICVSRGTGDEPVELDL
jgi:ferredoxin-NADP reductase